MQTNDILHSIPDEDAAFSLLWAMSQRFGWAGLMFSVTDCMTCDADGGEMGRLADVALLPGEYERAVDMVSSSYTWRKGIDNVISDVVAEVMPMVVVEDGKVVRVNND